MWTDNRRLFPTALVIVILAGFALRMPLLDRFAFREDEALYSYWALHGWRQDWQFLSVWPDKPPLFLWLLGLAYRTFGLEPASARWVSIAASTLTIPVVSVSAHRLWGSFAGLIAACVVAFNPFAISMAPTAYVDPVLVLFGATSICLVLRNRPLFAGLFLGAAMMTKQQGVLFIPLTVALLAARAPATASSAWPSKHLAVCIVDGRWLRLLIGAALVILPILAWDSQRWAVAPSPWDLGVRNYAAIALLEPAQWLQRLRDWTPLLWLLAASHVVWLLLSLMLVSAMLTTLTTMRSAVRGQAGMYAATDRRASARNLSQIGPRNGLHDWLIVPLLLLGWTASFVLVHVIFSVQVWDRYLLPVVPLLALLSAWAGSRAMGVAPKWARAVAVTGLLLLLALPARQAALGALPIGGDHGAYDGVEAAETWLARTAMAEASDGTGEAVVADSVVLYHHALGWHHQFYLYEPIARGVVELRWFSSSTYLADNAEKTPGRRKYYVQPAWDTQPDLAQRLAMRGLTLSAVARFDQVTVYAIGQPSTRACDWCLCTEERAALVAGWRVVPSVRAQCRLPEGSMNPARAPHPAESPQ